MRPPRLGQRRSTLVPVGSVMGLTWELSVPRLVAHEHAEQIRPQEAPSGRGQSCAGGEANGAADRAGLWAGCPSRHRRRMCARAGPNRRPQQDVRTFGTTAAELLALRDWLEGHGVTHVAMESTGVYWKPVFYVLEDSFTCLLVNATHIKQVPGRKTDVRDCVWIAQLLEHGLLRGSFVPPAPIRELRDLTRHRKVLIQERSRAANRLHKLLQDAGIKLASVATDILGVSARAMLDALVEGTTDPDVLADLARGKLRKKLPALRQALTGRFRPHHAFLVSQLLAHVDYLNESITAVSEEVAVRITPFAARVEQLDTIPGINTRTAEVIIAELGVDMHFFPSDRHLASWAALSPGNHESAGKHASGKTRQGNRWLRTALIEAATAAIRTRPLVSVPQADGSRSARG